MKNQILDFFTLHRQIFGICPDPDCGSIFRLSDCHVYLKKRPVADWMDALAREEERLARLEEKLEEREQEIREKAREAGRRQAARAVRKIDSVFAPRKLNPDDAKVIFHPIDYVVFNGMKDKEAIKNIILLDRKPRSTDHRRLQRSIEKAIEKGRYEWQTVRANEDGTIKVER